MLLSVPSSTYIHSYTANTHTQPLIYNHQIQILSNPATKHIYLLQQRHQVYIKYCHQNTYSHKCCQIHLALTSAARCGPATGRAGGSNIICNTFSNIIYHISNIICHQLRDERAAWRCRNRPCRLCCGGSGGKDCV